MVRRYIVAAVLCIAVIAAFAACEGGDGAQGIQGPAGSTGPPGPEGPGNILGFASCDADSVNTPTIFNFGGAATDSVQIRRNGFGNYTVSFFGDYPGVTGVSDVTLMATVFDTDNFHVASVSADQSSATSTRINVRVFIWSTSLGFPFADDVDFSVLALK